MSEPQNNSSHSKDVTSSSDISKSLHPSESLQNEGFWQHVSDLKHFVMWSVAAIFLGAVISLCFIHPLWDFLLFPFPKDGKAQLINIAPQDAILINLRVAMLAGFVLASPIILWKFYHFVAPGLFKNERSLVLPLMFWSVFLMLSGSAFAFGVAIPFSLHFLESYGHGMVSQSWTQQSYLDFVIKVTLAFGVMFEIPVVCWLLARMELLTSQFMKEQTRMAIVVIFILAAVVTPPDVASQMLLAIPMLVLYFVSIFVVKRVEKNLEKARQAE